MSTFKKCTEKQSRVLRLYKILSYANTCIGSIAPKVCVESVITTTETPNVHMRAATRKSQFMPEASVRDVACKGIIHTTHRRKRFLAIPRGFRSEVRKQHVTQIIKAHRM